MLQHLKNSVFVVGSSQKLLVFLLEKGCKHPQLVFFHNCYCLLKLVFNLGLFAKAIIQELKLLFFYFKIGFICSSFSYHNTNLCFVMLTIVFSTTLSLFLGCRIIFSICLLCRNTNLDSNFFVHFDLFRIFFSFLILLINFCFHDSSLCWLWSN